MESIGDDDNGVDLNEMVVVRNNVGKSNNDMIVCVVVCFSALLGRWFKGNQ